LAEGAPVSSRTKEIAQMKRRVLIVVALVGSLAACAGGDSDTSAPPADLPPGTTSPPGSGTTEPSPTAGTTTPGGELYPGFEFERVVQMDPADLPDGIPVPVPAGGEIDPSIGAFEGELLAVTYQGPYFATAVAFYGTWLQMEQIEASPLFGSGEEVAGWEFDVDGVPVRIEIANVTGGQAATVDVFWG
jgi:hypothetical protein